MIKGQAAISWLADHLDEEDAGASAHWRDEHKSFRYEDGKFSGLRGFGHHAPPARGLRRLAHQCLQKRFRNMGRPFRRFDELDRMAESIVAKQNRHYELDVLRQVLSLACLIETAPECFGENKTVLVIGDGFGTMASLALAAAPGVRVITVNLTKTLLVDLVYSGMAMTNGSYALAIDSAGISAFHENQDIRLLGIRADDAALLQHMPVDLIVNIASMQEMALETITSYFGLFRSFASDNTFFYCSNREEKILLDGTVVRFDDYPWSPEDQNLFDELCPWHQFYYSPLPPFYRPYNGPIRHRLSILDKPGLLSD